MSSAVGFDNLLWFMGIVEDNVDPTGEGRVRVRCFGIHPPADSEEVRTEDLPWAVAINGSYGASSQIPMVSDWVFGFFVDGRDAQHPMLLGMVPGQNMQLFAGSGSSDPYTAPSIEAAQAYGRPTLHPAQSGENLETTQLVLQNSGLNDGPGVPIGSNPHKNVVWRSRYGDSYMQIDGTPNDEFMLLSHESGSHILIDSLGNIKISCFGDSFMSSQGNAFERTSGSRSIEIEGEYTLRTRTATIEVSGDLNHTVNGNYNLNVGGRIGMVAGNGFEVAAQRVAIESVSEHINLKSAEKIKASAGGIVSVQSGGNMFLTSGGNVDLFSVGVNSLTSGGTTNITGGGNIALDGANIHLNSGEASAASATTQEAMSPQLDEPVPQNIETGTNERNFGSIGTIASVGAAGASSTDDPE